ncbi:MAG TPA: hypothetical protein VFQ61_10895 [Polyangiaceae bacterium]|nr:hypothetical protein [Polyangiaceae bacterium]
MTSDREPRRWLEDASSDPELRELLQAGCKEEPSRGAIRAAPAAIAALLSTHAVSGAAAAAVATKGAASLAGASGVATTGLVVKWVAVGALIGTSVSMAAFTIKSSPESSSRSKGAIAQVQSVPARETTHERVAPPVSGDAVPAPAASSPVAMPEPSGGGRPNSRADLSREVSELDAARAALARGHAEQALLILNAMELLPNRALVPEASVLRVRALLRVGQREQAERVAERFLERAPNAPQSRVLRALLAGTASE